MHAKLTEALALSVARKVGAAIDEVEAGVGRVYTPELILFAMRSHDPDLRASDVIFTALRTFSDDPVGAVVDLAERVAQASSNPASVRAAILAGVGGVWGLPR